MVLGGLGACTCIDPSTLDFVAPDESGACPSAFVLCEDHRCWRESLSHCAPDGGEPDGGCVPGGACTTNAGAPCWLGAYACTPNRVCRDDVQLRSGTACGSGLVCAADAGCVPCHDGDACQLSNACVLGFLSCATGCQEGARLPRGTSCPGGVCDGDGGCTPCVAGQACATDAGECFNGAGNCSSGAFECIAVPSSAGTSCGTSTCDGFGHCGPCVAGAACTSAALNPCIEAVTACTDAGTTVCVQNGGSDLDAGVACAPGSVCDGAGNCQACAANMPCTTNPNPCRTGLTRCDLGPPARCGDNAAKPGGVPCIDAGFVCDGNGACGACDAGAACDFNPGAPCRRGYLDCTSGAPRCLDGVSAPIGTQCPTGMCDGNGSCAACVVGAPCVVSGCLVGVALCNGSAMSCMTTGLADAGTPCGANHACTATGTCVTCGDACTAPDPCFAGAWACDGGAPRCVDAAPMPGADCGAGGGAVCDFLGRCGDQSCASGCIDAAGHCSSPTSMNCGTGGEACTFCAAAEFCCVSAGSAMCLPNGSGC
jgi:hypothetical protein